MERALNEGDYVILRTGAIATARRSYPAGYTGPVEILLDGAEESESADALTLPEMNVHATDLQSGAAVESAETSRGEARGQSVRMED